jgi:hypothetical protein
MIKRVIRPAALFAAYVSFSTPAYAYLDPATGSIMLQAAIGVIASWVMYSKMFAAKARSFFGRLGKGRKASDAE